MADDIDSNWRQCAAYFAATHGLTQAEAEIAAALAHGGRAPEIARVREVSMNTLRTQRRRAYAKLGVRDQIDLIHSLATLWPRRDGQRGATDQKTAG